MQLAGLSAVSKFTNMNEKNRKEKMKEQTSSLSGGMSQGDSDDCGYADEAFEDDNDEFSVWSQLCDVTTCIESPVTANSPTGYALDAAGTMQSSTEISSYMNRNLPKPPESVACILPPEKFKVTSVVHRPEHLDIFDSPIALPSRYVKALNDQMDSIQNLRDMLSVVEESGASVIEKTINNNFIDWLVQTEKTNHIIDLIKMDRAGSKFAGNINTAIRAGPDMSNSKGMGGGLTCNYESEENDDLFMHTNTTS